jgi:hypothetical protein
MGRTCAKIILSVATPPLCAAESLQRLALNQEKLPNFDYTARGWMPIRREALRSSSAPRGEPPHGHKAPLVSGIVYM